MKAIIINDILEIEGLQLTSGNINTYELEVEHNWEDVTIEALFVQEESAISVPAMDGKVIIPKLNFGKWNIGFIGYKIENEVKTKQISTNLQPFLTIIGAGDESIITENQEIPTPTIWEQYLSTMNEILEDTTEIRNEINNKYDEYNQNSEEKIENFNSNYTEKKQAIDEICQDIQEMKESVEQTKSEVDTTAIEVETARQEVSENKDTVEADKEQVAEDKISVNSTYADFLHQLGSEVATLINGKIPVSQIPSIATTEIYTVTTVEEMNVLSVQNGDICIVTEEDKSYIYNNGWIFLVSPTDYSSRSGYAEQAGIAEDSYKINGKRVISMTQEAYDNAFDNGTLLEDTFYFVPKEE